MKYHILFLLLLISSLGFSQVQLSGKVFNEENNNSLAYASVIIKNTNIGVLTDAEGVFEIRIPKKHAKDSLVINYIGFESKVFPIDRKRSSYPLTPSENTIEQVVVTPIDADSIMQLMEDNYVKNHIKHNTKQAGFMRASFTESGELFQVSESTYNVFYEKKNEGAERSIHPTKSRMVIDSAAYKHINEVFHFKKDTFLVEPLSFISIGQSFNSQVEDKEDRKWSSEYEYLGKEEYQGREAYRINSVAFRKKSAFMNINFLVDVETYALLSFEYETVNPEQINKLVPFAAKVLMSVLGYKFRINDMRGKTYFRYNGDFFELDKGVFYMATDVARGGDWIKGNMTQEFYLKEQVPVTSVPEEVKWLDTEIVSDFTADYFKQFHLPTTAKTKEQIAKLQEKNQQFSGEIYSDKHKKWLKKQEKKKR